MSVTPDSLAESAVVGSTTPRVDTIRIANLDSGVLPWYAQTDSAAWLSIQPASGMTPGTLQVRADPTGLAAGVYRNDVIVSTPTVPQISIRVVMVEFRIHP